MDKLTSVGSVVAGEINEEQIDDYIQKLENIRPFVKQCVFKHCKL